MPPRRAHQAPSDVKRVTLPEIAAEIGRRTGDTERLLRLHGWWLGAGPVRRRGARMWEASVIEKLRGLLDQPHRQLEPPGRDWLAQHVKEH